MKRLLVIVLLLTVSVATSQTNVSGIISQNTNWTKSGSPYIVTNNLLVSMGVTLTVESGVTVKIKGGKTLQILGELNAIGTQNDSIIITDFDQTNPFKSLEFGDSSEDVLFNSDGSWASGNILKFVKVLGGGENANGSVIFASSTGLIENSTVAGSNSSGIYLYKNTSHVNNGWMGSGSSSLKSVHVVSSEILTNNSNGFSCSCYQYNVGIIISDSKLNYNGGSGFTSGGGDSGGSHEFRITNNQFSFNQGKGYEGLTNGNQYVRENLVSHNESDGIRVRGNGTYVIRLNTIVSNSGLGVHGIYASIKVDSNVIAFNNGAIEASQGGSFDIIGNQILSNKIVSTASGWGYGPVASGFDPVSGNSQKAWSTPVDIRRNSFSKNVNDTSVIAIHDPDNGSPTFAIDSNNFGGNESKYYIYNTRTFSATNGVNASHNYFNGNDANSMSDSIYDWSDNGSLSIVSLTNVSDSVNSFAPVLPPKKVFIYPGINDYIVVEADLPSDFSNYRLYKGDCLYTDFTNDSSQLSNFNVDSISYYSLTVRSNSASGCEDFFTGEESYHFTDIKLPFDLKSESSFCYGDSVKFIIERNKTTAVQATFFVTISDANNVLLTDTILPGVSICHLDLQDSLRNDTTYTITISSNGFNYSRTTSVQLLKNPNFQISYSGDPVKCPGIQKTIEVPNGLTNVNWYRYQPWGTQGMGSSSSILAAGGTSYFFRATGQDGCVNYSDTLGIDSIAFNNMPTITSDVPSNFCEGVSFNLSYVIPANRMYYFNASSSQWGSSSPRISARWYQNDTLIDSVAYNPTITNNFGLNDSLAGVYKIRVGFSSCYRESAITMNALPNVDVTVSSVTNNTCYGDSLGSIIVTSQTANNYNWTSNDSSSIPNNDTLSNLPAGIYNLVATRSNGCSKSLEFNITEPSEITVSSVTESTTCNGDSDGAIYLSVTDAVQPYIISWAGLMSSNDTLEQLPAGIYVATIVDSNNCNISDSILVSQPDVLSIQLLSSNNVNCYQGQDGLATVSISGGNGGYVSSWKEVGTSSILSSTTTLSNVQGGVYRYTVVDSKGCTDSLDVTITQPLSALNASISSKTDVLCNGDSTGSITAQAIGGTIGSGYTYLWTNSSNSSIATSSVAAGLSSGIYTCQVTDVNGCTHQINDTILEPSTAVAIAASGTANVLCFGGNTGSVWVDPSGGVSPYSFNWNNLVTNDTIVNLVAGTYSVNVTDDNGCTENQSFSVTQPTQLTNSFTKSIYNGNTNVSCPGGTNGSIDLTPSGGSAPYTYLWSNTNTIQDINGLSAGTYSCTITDDNNCTSVANVSMTDPQDFVWSSSITDVSCSGLDDGAINLGISGGNQPYIIDWTSSSVSQGQVEVTFRLDMSQQSSFSTSSVTNVIQGFSAPLVMSDLSNDSIFILSQKFNPGDTIYWRYFNGSTSEIVPLSCGINTSQSVFERFVVVPSNDTILPIVCLSSCQNCQGTSGAGLNGSIQNTSKSLSDIGAGVYTFNLLDRNGCTTTLLDTVLEPAPLVLTLDSTVDASCPQNLDGYIAVSVIGGSGNYNFVWSNGDTMQNINAGYGYHSLVVTDANGCQDSATYLIDAPFPYNDEELCVVTVDTTGVNLVVWEKTPSQRTADYVILRENAATQYVSVGNNTYLNMSTWADQNSNPAVQPYRYKLVLQDSCGNYSDTSDYHATIHLQASQGVAQNEVNLQWTAYEGKQVQTYYIYRWLSPINRVLVDSVSSNVYTYTDIYPVTTTITALLYEVGAKFVNGGCSPSTGKQSSYANSMSNVLDWGQDGGLPIGTEEWVDVVLGNDLDIYPNPTRGALNLELKGAWEYQEDINIKILDITGKVLATSITNGAGTVQFDFQDLQAGVYIINIITNEGRIIVKRFERVN